MKGIKLWLGKEGNGLLTCTDGEKLWKYYLDEIELRLSQQIGMF